MLTTMNFYSKAIYLDIYKFKYASKISDYYNELIKAQKQLSGFYITITGITIINFIQKYKTF